MSKSALLVIDIQHDFLPGGSLAVTNGDEIIKPILSLITDYKWDSVVLSQDWHPKDHISFASNHPNGVKPFESVEFRSTKDENVTSIETVWPNHCVQHTHGANFPVELIETYKSLEIPKTIIQKGQLQDRDYYSAFNDIWDDDKTELDDFLKKNDIKNVFLCGLAYDYCVKFSAESSSKLGYKTYVLKSLSKAIDIDKLDQTDRYYKASGVEILEDLNNEALNRLKK